MKNDKVLLGILGAAAAGLAVRAIQIIKERREEAVEEDVISFDLEDLDNE